MWLLSDITLGTEYRDREVGRREMKTRKEQKRMKANIKKEEKRKEGGEERGMRKKEQRTRINYPSYSRPE